MAHQDFYRGFEGEPELVVERRVNGVALTSIHAWSGYFCELMESVPPTPAGWTGIALHHHLGTGWYEAPEWEDPDPAETLRMLEAARHAVPAGTLRLLADALCSIAEAVVAEGGVLVWREE